LTLIPYSQTLADDIPNSGPAQCASQGSHSSGIAGFAAARDRALAVLSCRAKRSMQAVLLRGAATTARDRVAARPRCCAGVTWAAATSLHGDGESVRAAMPCGAERHGTLAISRDRTLTREAVGGIPAISRGQARQGSARTGSKNLVPGPDVGLGAGGQRSHRLARGAPPARHRIQPRGCVSYGYARRQSGTLSIANESPVQGSCRFYGSAPRST